MLTEVDEHLTTSALAVVDLPISSWEELNEATDGKLQILWVPRQV
jgi:hypothetical protein